MASDEGEYMRRMADALRSGAKMLAEYCPVCKSPLFEIKGQLWCLRCNKRVIKVRGDEEIGEALTTYTLSEAQRALTSKIEEVAILLSRAADPDEVKKLAETLSILLKALHQSLNLKKDLTA